MIVTLVHPETGRLAALKDSRLIPGGSRLDVVESDGITWSYDVNLRPAAYRLALETGGFVPA